MDTRRKNQLFLYLDIVILGIGAIALVALVHDAFAGGYAATSATGTFEGYAWRMAAETALVATAMVYFLVRFFKIRVREMANPWG